MDYRDDNDRGHGKCLQCGEEFYGRPDKKFCSIRCKNEFHYQSSGGPRLIRSRVFTALSANYRILNALIDQGIKTAYLDDLVQVGFVPTYITGHNKTKHDEYSCFDIKYFQSGSKIFNLRKSDLENKTRKCQQERPASSRRNLLP